MIKIYTDGSCLKNPGPGGWSVLISLKNGIRKESGGKLETTNNEMELTAALEALNVIQRFNSVSANDETEFEIYSDSAYVVNAVNSGWLENWKNNHWKTARGKEIKNKKLWMHMFLKLKVLKKNKIVVRFKKVKGHSGNSLNELADKVAREQAMYFCKKEG